MTFQPGANLYTQGFGSRPENLEVPEIQARAPTSLDVRSVGKFWVDTSAGSAYVCSSQTSSPTGTASTWVFLGAAAGDLNTLTTADLTIVIPSSGNIDLVGSGSITTTGSGDTATVTLTGLTNHNVLVGAGTSTITKVSPSATSGIPLVSAGSSADPHYSTAVVAGGGTGATTLTAHGVLVGEGTSAIAATSVGTNGQVLLGATGADPAFGTLTSSTGVTFTTGTNSLAIDVKAGGFAVTPVSGTSQALSSQTTYIANNASLTTFTLPTTSAVGDVINVIGSQLNVGGWKITYTTGQVIWGPGGSSTPTSGNAATGAAAAQTCSLVCTVANTTWVIFANSGTITLT